MNIILLVDDDQLILDSYARLLKRKGLQVITASGGAEALAYQGHIDLLLTDIQMPKINGIELANTLKDRHPGLAILFMTGLCPPHLREQARCIGPLLDKGSSCWRNLEQAIKTALC